MQPTCVKCEVQLKPTINGAVIIETQRAKSGEDTFENRPLRIWQGDVAACPKCGAEIVALYGRTPVIEMFEPGAASRLEDLKSKARRVIYCHER